MRPISTAKAKTIPMPGGINDLNKGLGFGLNARGSSAAAGPSRKSKKPKKPKKGKSVFDDDDGSSSDESSSGAANAGADGRSSVNAEIAQEQAALRRRAEAAMKAAAADTVYNYDDGFEEFSTSEKAKKETARKQQQGQPERKARYISTLLQTANKRKREQDIAHERRVAREQAAEEQSNAEEFAGKEKFVTKSYKRKLAEREEWLREEHKKEEEEKQAEVDRREGRGGLGMASFLGSVVRQEKASDEKDLDEDGIMGGNCLDGFARGEGGSDDTNRADEYRPKLTAAQRQQDISAGEAPPSQPTKEEEEATLRRTRNAKIVAARERYLERKKSGKSASLFAVVR